MLVVTRTVGFNEIIPEMYMAEAWKLNISSSSLTILIDYFTHFDDYVQLFTKHLSSDVLQSTQYIWSFTYYLYWAPRVEMVKY